MRTRVQPRKSKLFSRRPAAARTATTEAEARAANSGPEALARNPESLEADSSARLPVANSDFRTTRFDLRASGRAALKAFRKARPEIKTLIAEMKADSSRLTCVVAASWLEIEKLFAGKRSNQLR